jgi:hypothetical protein
MMNEQRIKSAAKQAVYYRNYRRARERAMTRLAQAYPDDYKELLEQEKANDEQQGKKWLDIDGNTSTSQLGLRSATKTNAQADTSNQRENQGNNGGEA